ncbi:hypothetical protein [Streptomyces sp. S1]|uniref:hypothetical protein n=1 Tax=Streptomyces sp. S1 TaxID=718288 RepID=UPI000EF7D711|nr:hypothetical protein [Streptomyces sp. S1]
MPFDQAEVRWDPACGGGTDGRWHGWFDVRIHADALRRHGLHPEQPAARIAGPPPPGWWQAAAERRTRR